MTTGAVNKRKPTSLEELVGRLMDALRWETAPAKEAVLVRGIHEARRTRRGPTSNVRWRGSPVRTWQRPPPGGPRRDHSRVTGPGAPAVYRQRCHALHPGARAGCRNGSREGRHP